MIIISNIIINIIFIIFVIITNIPLNYYSQDFFPFLLYIFALSFSLFIIIIIITIIIHNND